MLIMKKLFFLILLLVLILGCNNISDTKRIDRIHKTAFTIDSHSDTPLRFTRSDYDLNTKHSPEETSSKVDFPRMQEGGLDAIFFAAFIKQEERTKEGNIKAKEKALIIIDSIYANVNRYPEVAEIVTTPEEAMKLEKKGKIAVFIGIENGYPIGNNINNIKEFYDRGVRYITLCHTDNNDICDSSTDEDEHGGLSDFGKKVVKEMNRLGIMIDVSHISDSSFYDVIELSEDPVIASHSCSRALCDSPRNLSDDMLKKLAEKGGVIQMCLYTGYVKKPEPNPERDSAYQALRKKYNNFEDITEKQYQQARKEWHDINKKYPVKLATVSDLVDHIDYIVDLIGIDYVGIGSDFDGGGALKDCYDVSHLKNITKELYNRGYSEEEIKKIWGGNLVRVFNEVNKPSGN